MLLLTSRMADPDEIEQGGPVASGEKPASLEVNTAEAAGTHSAVDGVQDDIRLNLYVSKLEEQKPEIERVSEESVAQEKIIPSKRNILENIVQYLLRGKFNLETMKVHQIVFDNAGNVVLLEVRAANTDGGNTEICYVAMGRKFGKTEALNTSIEWTWTSGEDFSMAESGDRVLNYRDGMWFDARQEVPILKIK